MPKMAHAGENHREVGVIGGGDHLIVANRAARLYNRRGARLRRRNQSVGKGKKGV